MFVLSGCAEKPQAAVAADTQSATSQALAQPAALAVTASGPQSVTGTVVEAMDASNYTYVRVKTGSREVWAAAAQFKVAVGDRVVVPLEMPIEKFHSQTLNRDFPLIYFTSSIRREGAAEPPAMAVAHAPTGGGQAVVNATPVFDPIAPAEGGTSVANVWKNRATLAGKSVTVRGKVVKFNGGILGTNWLHIQDGSGVASDGTHDLTVTTTASVKVGDIITITGIVAVDKDFGAGYAYAVIVEGATVAVK